MHVSKLDIKDFRGIGHLQIEFADSRPVVFIGGNGSGKSSVLDAILLVVNDLDEKLGSADWDNRRNAGFQFEDIPLIFSELDIRLGSANAIVDLQVKLKPDTTISWRVDRFDQNRPQFSSNDTSIYERSFSTIVYYPTIRRILDIPLTPKSEQFERTLGKKNKVRPFPEEIDFHTFFSWFRLREDIENQERINDSRYRDVQIEAVRHAIELVMPEYTNLRVYRNPDRLVLHKEINGTRTEFNMFQMSDGEKGFIALVGDIARRLAIANDKNDDPDIKQNPLQGSGIVMIDEIELHLHPGWQRTIVPALTRTFPNIQFFFTTHSPQVVSEIENPYIFLLEAASNTNDGIKCTELYNLYGRDTNRILEDIMGVPERPQQTKEELSDLFRLIDDGNITEAKEFLNMLINKYKFGSPDFVRADILIRKKEILNH